jgi:hypothetical protein
VEAQSQEAEQPAEVPDPGALPAEDQVDDKETICADVAPPAEEEEAIPSEPVDRIGLASFLLGSLALPAASFGWLRYLAVALALGGGILGVLGLVRWWCKEQVRVYFPAIGLGACLMALLLAAWSGPWLAGQRPERTDEDGQQAVRLRGGDTSPEGSATTQADGWVDAGRDAVHQGAVRVRVLSATVQSVLIQDARGQQRRLKERALILRLRLVNVGLGQLVQYRSWSAPGVETDKPTLVDNLGRSYPGKAFDSGWSVVGQVRQAGLAPAKWADDVLVFKPPPPDITFLRLTLPAAAFGGKGQLRWEIPRQMIGFR